jgi:hypothetical protein
MVIYRQKLPACKYKALNLTYSYNNCPVFSQIEKTKKIDKLISNIYIYKFPPVLNWPDGINIDIPVDFVIAVRKILEHISFMCVDNIDELCFAFGADCSSYGDKILIIPIEYVLNTDLRKQFPDVFAHEAAHALAFVIFKDKHLLDNFKNLHKTIKTGSNESKSIFFEPKNSSEELSCYQYEDYAEFFAELASQILIHYKELIKYVSFLKYSASRQAYLDAVNFLLCFITPIPEIQVINLIKKIVPDNNL